MNVGSLFSGVGGFDLGLERAGHRIVFQCEVDPRCRKILRKHWPDVPLYEDVRDLREESFGDDREIDLLCGGFPCQDLSQAGKRAGLEGERSGLFFDFARIADFLIRPGGWILLENVANLLASKDGRDFALLVAALGELGFHDLSWRLLDSRYFGVAQRRRRVFVLARRSRGRRAAEVLLEPEGSRGDPAPGRESPEGDTARAEGGATRAERSDHASGSHDHGELNAGGHQRESAGLPDGAALLSDHEPQGRQGWPGIPGHQTGAHAAPPYPDGVRTAPGVPGRLDRDLIGFRSTAGSMGADAHLNASPTVVRGASPPAVSGDLAVPDSDRCALDLGPDGLRYEGIGNAVTVPVAEWIGRRLAAYG